MAPAVQDGTLLAVLAEGVVVGVSFELDLPSRISIDWDTVDPEQAAQLAGGVGNLRVLLVADGRGTA